MCEPGGRGLLVLTRGPGGGSALDGLALGQRSEGGQRAHLQVGARRFRGRDRRSGQSSGPRPRCARPSASKNVALRMVGVPATVPAVLVFPVRTGHLGRVEAAGRWIERSISDTHATGQTSLYALPSLGRGRTTPPRHL